ncbi:MIP/aquaporin family protein [Haemophilus influenzae]|uniref:Glycerol uptake facilitator protein n=1 Tax=Haemophilus influenzae (strain PittGG) TaxID=374931 RepID=A5UIE9_HAEIG|nr:MIP/aquaporin family protein [Haemophilus influenzae]ABR00555.1 glycerol uptake facilitator protein [Haemophilus influenzae PittGG]MCK8788628.1 aquaporin family protein [Haemophilus influenzae]MCK8863461.1 aquaporin family protein [Haemophilus influenzae]MCK9059464.1 aquaporin family protein [Haemophilus influenzae]MDO7264407.1 MIP/aquaporin family protein [Haemophilus influenzae]
MENINLYLGELVGTAFFMVLGLGVCANISLKKSGMYGSGGLLAACGWGLSMVSIAVIFGSLTGAHVNPAVTIGFWAVGQFSGELVFGYIVSQCIGAFIGALIVWQLFKDHLDEEENQNCQLGSFATIATNSNNLRNLFSEIVATFSLLFILFALGHQQPAKGVAMFFVFAGVAGGVMSFGGLTGYAINPARDFMPRLVHAIVPIKNKGSSNFGYAWVPIFGPIIGALLAAWLYKALF